MNEDAVTLTKAQFATVLRWARAEAWQEGWEACHAFMGRGILPPNPYRIENGAGQ